MIKQPMLPKKPCPSFFKEKAACQLNIAVDGGNAKTLCKQMSQFVGDCQTCQPGSSLWWKWECFVLAVIVLPE